MTENGAWKDTLAIQRLSAELDVPAELVWHIHGAGQAEDDVPQWVVVGAAAYVHTKQQEITRRLTALGILALPNGGNLALPTSSIAPEMFMPEVADSDAVRYLYDTRVRGRYIVFHAATPAKAFLCTGEPPDNPEAWQDWEPFTEGDGGRLAWYLSLSTGAACHKCKQALRESANVAVVWREDAEPEAAGCRDLYTEIEKALAAVTPVLYTELSDKDRRCVAGLALDAIIRGDGLADVVRQWWDGQLPEKPAGREM